MMRGAGTKSIRRVARGRERRVPINANAKMTRDFA
jgi:hypothetical protein